jgi:predicted phosphodiesterase
VPDERVAVFSDVHADATALRSIFNAVDRRGIARIWCLGDFCARGSDPAECYDLTRSRCEVVLAGNHELMLVRAADTLDRRWRGIVQETNAELGDERVRGIRDLPHHAITTRAELVHGSLEAPAFGFIEKLTDAQRQVPLLTRPLLLFGHTHKAGCWQAGPDGEACQRVRPRLDRALRLAGRVLINPGHGCSAAGARWLELDFEEERAITAVWRRTEVAGAGPNVYGRGRRAHET